MKLDTSYCEDLYQTTTDGYTPCLDCFAIWKANMRMKLALRRWREERTPKRSNLDEMPF